jgi:hypothetical protein
MQHLALGRREVGHLVSAPNCSYIGTPDDSQEVASRLDRANVRSSEPYQGIVPACSQARPSRRPHRWIRKID